MRQHPPRARWPEGEVLVDLLAELSAALALSLEFRSTPGGPPTRLPVGRGERIRSFARGPEPIVLVEDVDGPAGVRLGFVQEAWEQGIRTVAHLSLPGGSRLEEGDVRRLFRLVCRRLDPHQAGLYKPRHRLLVHLPAANRAAAAQPIVPPPGARLPDLGEGLATELETPVRVAALDLARVPESIWWLNYWSADVLANWEADRLARAPWSEPPEKLERGQVLCACSSPPEMPSDPGFESIAALSRFLELGDLQSSA